jgi:hypothetical protein
VQPLTLGELVEDAPSREALLAECLRYTQTNGTVPCAKRSRRSIRAARPTMQVTNGGAEANYITTWNLVEPGDEVAMMVPNFMQAWGLARVRRESGGVAARAARQRRARRSRVARRHRRARAPGDAAHEADRDLQSEQPDRDAHRGGRLDRIAAIADRHGS